jgi:hypothetical protein
MNIVQGFEFFKTNAIAARLYRANGEIVEPTPEGKKLLNAPISTSWAAHLPNGMYAPQVMTYFPWGTSALEESWVEITIGPERYWVEIPYGFDRNPNEPLPPSIPGGRPKFVPAMKTLTDHDHVMRWQTVHYDLGVIQNGWRLSLIQSNSVDAESEVVLYREDVKIGTATSWETNSPATALRVLDASGMIFGSHCTDVHIQDGGMERSNMYDIARNQCHPVNLGGTPSKGLEVSNICKKSGVSDLNSVLAFSSAPAMPSWRNARWKGNFFATHGLDSPRTISSLCSTL